MRIGLVIFSLVYFFFSRFFFPLPLGDGPISIEILSQRVVKTITTNNHQVQVHSKSVFAGMNNEIKHDLIIKRENMKFIFFHMNNLHAITFNQAKIFDNIISM